MGIIDRSINDIKYYWVGFKTSKIVNKMVIWLNGLVLGLDLETGLGLGVWICDLILGYWDWALGLILGFTFRVYDLIFRV